MLKSQKTSLADVVKLKLNLNNTQYETVYSDIEVLMQKQGILGKQLRSIRAKAETRQIATNIQCTYSDILGCVLDKTFNTNIMLIT
jgi:hypothetical protein